MSVDAHFQSKSTISVRTPHYQPIEVDKYGQLAMQGESVAILRITHIVEHPNERTFIGIVDGKKQLIPKRELRKDGYPCFECRFDLRNESQAYANVLRLVRVNAAGMYEVTEVGITKQFGKLFVSAQVLYQGYCYNDAGCIVVPRFEKPWVCQYWHVNPWPVMVDRLQVMLNDLGVTADALPSISTFKPPVHTTVTNENEGVVIHFNFLKGYGVVQTKHGLAYVSHREVVAPGCPFRKLTTGDRVVFARRMETEGLGYPATLFGVRTVA